MSEKLHNIRIPKKQIRNLEKIDRKKLQLLRQEELCDVSGAGSIKIFLYKDDQEKIYIERIIERNHVRNIVDQYEQINDQGTITITPLTIDIGNIVLDRFLENKSSYNSYFVFGEFKSKELNWVKSSQEHKFTSTGIKFWRHEKQMFEYKRQTGGLPRNSVVTTHISPEGACNLKCPYCSVTYRDTHSRIALSKIKQYVTDLKSRGLKAVILTGGGEPTLYPQFNELVQWIKNDQNLSVALITNGTTGSKIKDETLACFSWVRVSINIFPGWQDLISLKKEALSENCIVGCSMVYTVEHEARDIIQNDRLEAFKAVSKIADKIGAKYIRLLPNCLLEQDKLLLEHNNLQKFVEQLKDERFFQQYKVHGTPSCSTCHQSYFRPYLSEEPFGETGEPGTIYPCDSVVLNDSATHFAKKYQLCKPENVLDYIDGKIQAKFDPRIDCTGCVFTDNVNMLDKWINNDINRFDEFKETLTHEEFV